MESKGHVVAYLSLGDFCQDVIAQDDLVRVDGIRSSHGGMVQWLVLVTAKTVGGDVAMASFLVGQVWEIFARDEPYHEDNAMLAALLVRRHLEGQGFVVAPGVWDPKTVMDHVVLGQAGLWRFEGKGLVALEEGDEG